MVHVNCAALPESLAESELFGHVKGAFSGATTDRPGRFDAANGGTLLLDEVGELPLTVQAKLLRTLQNGEIQRLGADQPRRVDVRIIAATNRNLRDSVRDGHFRADLYHRLSVYPAPIPPLRERGNDVLILAGHFLELNRARLGLRSVRLSPTAERALLAGLNLDEKQLDKGLQLIREKGRQLYVAVNTYAQPEGWERWQRSVDQAADMGVDALLAADPGVLGYASKRHPKLKLHLSVQGSATNAAALGFYQERYGISRAVLPRVLSLKQVKQVAASSPVPIEVFAFGSLCIMAEGRCHLSSYLTGESPNLCGVCSPAKGSALAARSPKG
ncbi:Anaerobic nitric oxide reductase transcription regulator NorR [Stutzerimonas stutzeri]